MSTHYNTEPTATASATLHTTLGPLHIALFASQTPLTCRNFLQHISDNYYTGTIFHRIVPNFILQGGDPTGTGSGGTSIYEDPLFEYDATARDPNEKVVLRDELHSRLKFNRRGLLGMAKSEDGTYGSQFFITLGDVGRELNGQCTIFGRIEGDSIYNVLKIAEGEVVEGTERPVYPIRVTGGEIGELGPLEGRIVKRDVTARATGGGDAEEKGKGKKGAQTKKKNKKGGKTLLSFGDEEGEEGEEMPVRAAKPKYNAALVTDTGAGDDAPVEKKKARKASPPRRRSPTPPPAAERPKSPDPAMQLPLPDPESPERSPSPPPAQKSRLDRTNAEIESIKASMRRTVATEAETGGKKSALEAMIPQTAIRGRKRPAPGTSTSSSATNGITGFSSSSSNAALKMFNAFKAKLEGADATPKPITTQTSHTTAKDKAQPEDDNEDEESQLCDLHFIANCQSCKTWSDNTADTAGEGPADDTDLGWLTHQLHFGKDTLGKDLKWKKEHPEDLDSLMVIDPREKEREIVASGSGSGSGKRRGLERDRERDRKRGRVGDLEWDKSRR
ncbi:cyclophilin-like protein [Aspergillus sclerotiicarbonarius CBS 121057]|uniref:Peptidyl-prolyl isomerase CWC27 n=1 Tax=Aspergillus sclerotiicarbonarius (strain CBS 121057 / IBT 28362) TaxID=1448318 RepID=A0A319EC75_ASPSB|nr:cyclophilin-like protein [Aspergillus sclerotiicarbonarius CBS 121057]